MSSPAGDWIHGYLHTALSFAQFLLPGRESDCVTSARRALRTHQDFGDKIGVAFTLEVLGWLSARTGKHKRTAWLLGAAGRLWDQAGGRLCGVSTLEAMHQDAKHVALAALSDRRFDGIQAMGADSPLNEVIAFAIGDVSIQVN
jgi:hypothetical protein